MHARTTAVRGVYTTLRIKSFEGRAERGDIGFVEASAIAIHCFHHGSEGQFGGGKEKAIEQMQRGRLDFRSDLEE